MEYEKIIKTGLAGFGMSGVIFQAPFVSAHPGFALQAVYERTTNRAEAAYPGVKTVRTFEALLAEDVELIIISTPNDLHYPMAKQALLAGKHVLAEKPVAESSEQALELAQLAKDKGLIFTVYQNRRWDGDFLTVKALMDSGRLGEVVDYSCRYDRFVQGVSSKPWKAAGGKTVNNLYDLGVHIIDQAYTLFGMPREIYADLRKERPQTKELDNFEVILYYPDRKVTLAGGELVVRQGPRYMVNGRKATFIKYGEDVQERALNAGQRPPMESWGVDEPENYGTLYTMENGTVTEEKIPTLRGDYTGYFEALYRSLVNGAPLAVDPLQCVDVLRIIEAALQSNREKRRIAM